MADDKKRYRSYTWFGKPAHDVRGQFRLYCDHVNQPDKGVDMDFLVGGSGAPVPRESH
jgi:L-arabonate dehydrase